HVQSARSDRDQIVGLRAGVVKLLDDVGYEPQVPLDEGVAGLLAPFGHLLEQLCLLLGRERCGEDAVVGDVGDKDKNSLKQPQHGRQKQEHGHTPFQASMDESIDENLYMLCPQPGEGSASLIPNRAHASSSSSSSPSPLAIASKIPRPTSASATRPHSSSSCVTRFPVSMSPSTLRMTSSPSLSTGSKRAYARLSTSTTSQRERTRSYPPHSTQTRTSGWRTR